MRNPSWDSLSPCAARRMLLPGNWPQWADLHVSNSPLHIWLLSLTAGDITGVVWADSSALCLCVTWDALPLYFINQQNCMHRLKNEISSGNMKKHASAVNDFPGLYEYTDTWNWKERVNIRLRRFDVDECNNVHTQIKCESYGTWAHH